MTTTHAAPPPGYYGQPPQKKGIGITAMVLGIVALVLAFIPIIGLISLLLGLVAVILGIVALIKKRGKGQGIAGLITGTIALIGAGIVTALTGAFVVAVDEGLQEAEREWEEEQEAAASEEGEDASIDELEDEVEDEDAPEDGSGEWVEVQSFSGSSDTRTDAFELGDGDYRLVYDFTGSGDELEFFGATVHLLSEGDTLQDGSLPEILLSEPESGDTYLYDNDGMYYLDISGVGYDSWTITIEEQQDSQASASNEPEGSPTETPIAEEPVAQEAAAEPEASSGDAAPDAEVPEWESDGGYVSRVEAEEAAVEGECPIGERNLDVDGLDCQPLSMSFDRYAEENGITFDEPEAEEPAYEDPESCGVLLYDVTVAGKRLEETVEGSAEFDAVLEEFLAARDIAEAAGC